jgi:hypothetical protein
MTAPGRPKREQAPKRGGQSNDRAGPPQARTGPEARSAQDSPMSAAFERQRARSAEAAP